MFKNKFKELVQKQKELTTISFQILNDRQTASISGGCRVLQSCGEFHGSCDRLIIDHCGKFYATIESTIE